MDHLLHYRISATLAQGEFGDTYLALDTGIERTVVLKPLPQHPCAAQTWREQHSNRNKTITSAIQTGSARVLSIEMIDNRPWLVREYIDGHSLAEIAASESVSYLRFLELARIVCRTLKIWHEADFCHGNLKPGNIIVDNRGQVVLADSGLDLIEGGPYRAPERTPEAAATPQTDLFALGVTLRHLAAGRTADQGTPRLKHLPGLAQLLIDRLTVSDPDERMPDVATALVTIEEMIRFRRDHAEEPPGKQHRFTPRQYLLLSVLAVLLVIFWLVITSTNR